MTGAARQLGEDLARALSASSGGGTVSAEVVDVTDAGTVNVMVGGALVTDVMCADSYRNRKAGDWVAVRQGARPVVMWRLGDDPGATDEATIRRLATEVALDEQVLRAATWGTAAPSGDGWQQVSALYLRKNTEGKVELYGQLGAQSDTSPDAPAGRAPKPVTVTASSSGSWRNGRRDDYRDYPFQGDYTGGGNLSGAWFYGNKISDACAGKTVAKMTVSFTRRRGSGDNAKRPMHLYLHDHNSPPSSLDLDEGPEELLSLSVGAQGTATLPAEWRSKLASGARKGLAIYARGSRDYAAFTGGSITITFS
ncbi:hypothetical protein OIU91_28330 [Streptomyces sp. NBC_01456]|uniref:hypothetical protein n=1 Tax=unclassified Streptomyces TaxID=2593676 RepID=UPI002E3193A5|nr:MULTISPECIES: hypothetical protein [unclassified Streptomyces]